MTITRTKTNFLAALVFGLLWGVLHPAQLRAQANIGPLNITATSTACATDSSCVTLKFSPNSGSVVVQITGTFTATLEFEATSNGTTWVAISGVPLTTTTSVSQVTAAGLWKFGTAGLTGLRVRASAYTSGGARTFIQSSTAPPSNTAS